MAAYAVFPGPWGPIHVAARSGAIVAIELMTPTDVFVTSLERRLRCRALAPSEGTAEVRKLLARAQRQVEEYLAGRRCSFDFPIELAGLSGWDRLVLEAVRGIPYGQVTSYGRLARLIGRPGAARAVGGAVGRNPIGLVIPCHRVIAGDGTLGGYGGGGYGGGWYGARDQLLALKRSLLDREGSELPATDFIG